MSKTTLLDLAKQTITDCSDIHCFDPETNADTGVGMALSERIKIIHKFSPPTFTATPMAVRVISVYATFPIPLTPPSHFYKRRI